MARSTVALLIALSLATAGCGSKHIKKTEAAYEALKAGNVPEAQANFEAALKKHSDYGPALVGMGNIAYGKKLYDEARGYYDRALQANSTNAEALWGRGKVSLRQVEFERAADDLGKAVSGGKAEANVDLGLALMLTDDGSGALAAFEDYAGVKASDNDRLRAVLGAARTGIKFNLAGDAFKVVQKYSFEDATLKAIWQRAAIDLAYAAGDWAKAGDITKKASGAQDFGFVVRELSPGSAKAFEGVGGAVVDMVHLGSPAERAGLRAGDIVTAFETVPITSASQLRDALKSFGSSKQAQRDGLIEVLRADDDAYYALRMTVGAYDAANLIRQAEGGATPRGFKVASDELAQWP